MSTKFRAASTRLLSFDVSGGFRSIFSLPSIMSSRRRERFVKELHRIEEPVRETHLEGFGAVDHAVLVQRIVNDEFECLFRADEPRGQGAIRPSPESVPGNTPGTRSRYRLGDGAVIAIKSDLKTSAEGRAVDRCQGGNLQIHDPLHGRVALLRRCGGLARTC